jgi:hypothetical protein
MKRNVLMLLAVETVLVVLMAFFGNYSGLQREGKFFQMICWRILLALPVIFIALDAVRSNPCAYTKTMLAVLFLIFAADVAIIFRFEAGLMVFLAVHALNIFNFTRISKKISFKAISGLVVMAAGYVLYKTTIAKSIDNSFMAVALQAYMFVIIVSFWRALETSGVSGPVFTVLISAGTLIFFIGDYFVARNVFLREEYHQIVNNTLYYVPHVLLALSAVYFKPVNAKSA